MAELALADRMQVSHSHLKGGPALWSDVDVEKALAYAAWKAGVHGKCGTHAGDWADGAVPFEAYDWRCTGCELIESYEHSVTKDRPREQMFGLGFGLRVPLPEKTEPSGV